MTNKVTLDYMDFDDVWLCQECSDIHVNTWFRRVLMLGKEEFTQLKDKLV